MVRIGIGVRLKWTHDLGALVAVIRADDARGARRIPASVKIVTAYDLTCLYDLDFIEIVFANHDFPLQISYCTPLPGSTGPRRGAHRASWPSCSRSGTRKQHHPRRRSGGPAATSIPPLHHSAFVGRRDALPWWTTDLFIGGYSNEREGRHRNRIFQSPQTDPFSGPANRFTA